MRRQLRNERVSATLARRAVQAESHRGNPLNFFSSLEERSDARSNVELSHFPRLRRVLRRVAVVESRRTQEAPREASVPTEIDPRSPCNVRRYCRVVLSDRAPDRASMCRLVNLAEPCREKSYASRKLARIAYRQRFLRSSGYPVSRIMFLLRRDPPPPPPSSEESLLSSPRNLLARSSTRATFSFRCFKQHARSRVQPRATKTQSRSVLIHIERPTAQSRLGSVT